MGGGQSSASAKVRQSNVITSSGCESFTLQVGPDAKVALKTLHGEFISVEQDGAITTASSWGEKESFTMEHILTSRSGKVSFISAHGGYLRADWNGGWDANATKVSGWEAFMQVVASDGTVALQTFHGTYLSAALPSHPITGPNGTELGSSGAPPSHSSSDSSSDFSSDSSSGPETAIMNLITGQEFELRFDEDDTVGGLKRRVAGKYKIPQRFQSIVNGSEVVEDHVSVARLRCKDNKLRLRMVLVIPDIDHEAKKLKHQADRPDRNSEGLVFSLQKELLDEQQKVTEGVEKIISACGSTGDGTTGSDRPRGRRSQRTRGRFNRRRQQMASPGRDVE